ncbi:MAG: HAMP domain-containing histidine kinase, partial [Deferribacteres bacterium]|nr:HAMP domain-containing histidine kinase [Deferribacteres bacterium]
IVGIEVYDNKGALILHVGNKTSSYLKVPVYNVSLEENIIFSPEQKKSLLGEIVIFYTKKHIQSFLRNVMYRSFVVALVLSLILALVIYWGVSRSFVKPMNQLMAAVRKLSDGDLEVRVDGKGLKETEALARAFSEMVSSLKSSRELLEKTYQEMAVQKSFAELGKFSLVVAHEIKNPLGIIKGAVDILKKEEATEEIKREMLTYIEDEVKRLDRLLKDFLSLAKPVSPKYKRVDVSEFFNSLIQRIRLDWPGLNIDLELTVDGEFNTDPQLMEGVLINMIKNACEAGAKNILVKVDKEGDMLKIEISDDGKGIKEKDRDRIFEPFYSTKKGGTGLGLAYVSRVIMALKGEISVYPNEPRGTRFVIRIPFERGEE